MDRGGSSTCPDSSATRYTGSGACPTPPWLWRGCCARPPTTSVEVAPPIHIPDHPRIGHHQPLQAVTFALQQMPGAAVSRQLLQLGKPMPAQAHAVPSAPPPDRSEER